jgi:hypothetical protein
MPTYNTTTKYALRWLLGANVGLDIDAGFQALAEDLDAIIATADKGVVGSRPTSSVVTPGKSGRFYFATDAADTGRLFFDYGTGWIDILQRTPTVSAFPTLNLYDGLEVLMLTGAMMAAGYPPIRFRYRAAGVYPWEAIGSSGWHQSWAGVSAGNAAITYGQIANISSAVEIVVPWPGQYLARWGYKDTAASAGTPTQEVYVVASSPGDLRTQGDRDRDATHNVWPPDGTGASRQGSSGQCLIQAAAANAHLGMHARAVAVPVAWTITDPWLEFTPLRVSPP